MSTGSREVGTNRAAASTPTAATGAMTTKTLPHQNCSSSKPPAIGPTATPRPVIAPQTPMARARSSRPVYRLEMIDSVAGKISAAPTPMTAADRHEREWDVSTSPPTADASAEHRETRQQRTLAAVAVAQTPACEHERGERQVVRVDYPLQFAGRWHRVHGRATEVSILTIVVSRLIMNTARHSTARAAPRREVFVPVMDKKLKCTDRKVKRFLIGFQA